eukprot:gb/GECG01001656.1/.p1 GENE.gb/GECG01001656.1/~~gb/GECG01001656.1/.p1  ORF type:complete len:318 (+),score=45.68 gb/GECG01001656.1/:1-954(+)
MLPGMRWPPVGGGAYIIWTRYWNVWNRVSQTRHGPRFVRKKGRRQKKMSDCDSDGGSGGITGPDSEEILGELCEKYAPRDIVALHRAVLRQDIDKIRELVQQKDVPVDATLFPREAYSEVKKCNELDIDAIPGVTLQSEPYPEVEQFETGMEGEPNELFPFGQLEEQETDLDTLFQSPLLRAAYVSADKSIQALLELGADKNFVSPTGNNAVMLCLCDSGDNEATARTLSLIATPELIRPPFPGGQPPEAGSSQYFKCYPLINALQEEGITSDTCVVEELLKQGAQIPPEVSEELESGSASSWIPGNIVDVLRRYVR